MGEPALGSDDFMAGLGPNERAMLGRVPTRTLRRLATALVRVKMRLQFTGWLQFVMPLMPLTVLLLLSGLAWLLGLPRLAMAGAVAGGGLLGVVLFDIITVKYRLRLPERRPADNEQLDLFDLMRARRSCRSFQTRFMSDQDKGALLDSVKRHVAAPTLGPSPVRLEYIRARLTVWPTVNGSEFLVAILPLPYNRASIIDVGRALQKVVMEATRRGLGTCWIGPGADHDSLRRHLGDRFDPTREQIICICAVGYPSAYVPLMVRVFNRTMGARLPVSELFFTDPALATPLDVHAPDCFTLRSHL